MLLTPTGCPDPCLDDGLLQDSPSNCPVATGSDAGTDTATGGEESGDEPLPQCANGVLDDGETDVDCGGNCENKCGEGRNCGADDDCASDMCSDEGVCVDPSCSNGAQDGDETDVDCGGSCPDGCGEGEGCSVDDDCMSENCLDDGTCGPMVDDATCTDGVRNGNETDVDCGGPDCDPCDTGEECMDGSDCASGVCEVVWCFSMTVLKRPMAARVWPFFR